MADETELLIDEVEIAATADLLRLEAMARDQDAYEDEIIRLTACLEDSRRRMQMLPSTGLKGKLLYVLPLVKLLSIKFS